MTLVVALAQTAAVALILIACITILNVLTFPRLDRSPYPLVAPFLSVLIPARNEASVIGETIHHLLHQDYPAYEVVLLDDGSTDGTAERARAAAGGDSRLRVMEGAPLPAGWSGKNWACHQLSQVACGEILVFTDADVHWTSGALSRLVGEMERLGGDLQTVWPTQITLTWSERLVVPLLAFVIVGYLPLLAVHYIPLPAFAAAMGQCLAFRRRAYEAVGGHAAVRADVVEDVAFAKRIKRIGMRLRVADGGRIILCRMYHTWAEVRRGFAKNILAGHGDSIPFLLFSWAFHWLLWLAPWIWLGVGWSGSDPHWPSWPLLLIGLGVGVRALTAAFSHQRVVDALWMPVSTLLMAIIAGQSIVWRLRYGGPQWKGRTLAHRRG